VHGGREVLCGEGGVDEGGLTQEMFTSFWRGVILPESGLFETVDAALPSPDANEERLELVGQFLTKSILTEKQIGRGLCPFVFEFLLGETERSFDPDQTTPLDKRVNAALRALKDFDHKLYKQYHDILVGFLDGSTHGYAEDFPIPVDELAPSHPDRDDFVTKDNVGEVIIAACKHVLWDRRGAQLLALKRGFTTSVLKKDPIDLQLQLLPFSSTVDLMLLVQGKEGISTSDLIERCVQWPDESRAATAENGGGFPDGSTTAKLLRELLEDESAFDEVRRVAFVRWVTALSVLPEAGLVGAENGKIKIRWDEMVHEGDETRWPLPTVSTCFHILHLADYKDKRVLDAKLREAMTWEAFEEKRD